VPGRIGDKWSLYVINFLGGGTRRFSELRRQIGGITPRMLTVTIRSLERDGLIPRTVYPVVPPRVEYALTPLRNEYALLPVFRSCCLVRRVPGARHRFPAARWT
jgi:DNA-binding HxlR family transcriptional regulator